MKFILKIFITICLIIGYKLSAFAQEEGYYLEELVITQSAGGGAPDTIHNRMWVADNKFRRIQGDESQITIGRLDKGLFWMINLNDNTYSEIDLETIRQLAQMTMVMMGAQMDDDGKLFVPNDLYIQTGEVKMAGDWRAHEITLNPKYAGTGLVDEFTMWISDDVDIPDELYVDITRSLLGDPNGEAKKLLKLLTALEGYPVLIESNIMGFKNTIRTTKIEKTTVSRDYFNLPSGLTEVANPLIDMFE